MMTVASRPFLCGALLFAAVALSTAGQAQPRTRLKLCVDSCSSALSDGQYQVAARNLDEAMALAVQLNDSGAVGEVLVKRSHYRMMIGDYNSSLTDLQRALSAFGSAGDLKGVAEVYSSMGSIHYYDRNFEQAQQYYVRSMEITRRLGDSALVAQLYGNIGSALEELGKPDSALLFHRRQLELRRKLGQQSWIPICYSNLGSCFDKLGISDSAIHYLEASLALHERIQGSGHSECVARTQLGLARLGSGDARAAIHLCSEALEEAERTRDLSLLSRCYHCLYKAHESLGQTEKALRFLELSVAARDSISGEQRAKELIRIELTYGFEQAQLADSLRRVHEQRHAEFVLHQRIARERDQKRLFLISSIGVLVLAGGLWSRLRYMQRSRMLIQQERDRSEQLLRNILPAAVAEELKANGGAPAREVDGVSMLFTDFHEFTRLSEQLSPQELVAEVHACFRAFDSIVARHGLEKIKTIGDAYMCAGGLPDPRPNSARDTVLAALEMQRWLMDRALLRERKGLPHFRMRAGIHTGPVVAGIVGESKFQYDVWGDTVNTASRMESAGAVDEVNISEATYKLIRPWATVMGISQPKQATTGNGASSEEKLFSITPRGAVLAKGKGELQMYFVSLLDSPVLVEHV